MNNLQHAMKRLEQSFAARSNTDTPRSSAVAPSGDQLPLHLAPPVTTSSAKTPPLFRTDIDDEPSRGYLRDRCVRLPSGTRISYRGEELRRDDWAVWGALSTAARQQNSERVEFAPRSLLKMMGWGVSVHDHNRLRACLERMQATSVKQCNDRPQPVVALSLIDKCEWRPSPTGRGGRWRVWIATEVQALFAERN